MRNHSSEVRRVSANIRSELETTAELALEDNDLEAAGFLLVCARWLDARLNQFLLANPPQDEVGPRDADDEPAPGRAAPACRHAWGEPSSVAGVVYCTKCGKGRSARGRKPAAPAAPTGTVAGVTKVDPPSGVLPAVGGGS